MRLAKSLQCGLAVQARDAAETAIEVGLILRGLIGLRNNRRRNDGTHPAILTESKSGISSKIDSTGISFSPIFGILLVRHLSSLFQLILISITAHIAIVVARITTSLFALSLHASEFTVGTLIALFALFPMLLAVKLGRIVDRVGLATPMLAGGALMLTGCAMSSAANDLAILYPAVLMIGTGFLAIHVSVQHAVGAMSDANTTSINFSWLALGYSISSFCGPVIAGFVIEHLRHNVAYGVAAGFAFAALVLMLRGNLKNISATASATTPQSDGSPGSVMELLRDEEMRRIYLVSILLGSAWDLFNFVMPIHGSHLGFSASTIGLILGCFSGATIVVRLAMQWLARHYSEWQILASALVLALVCYAIFPFMKTPMSIMIVTAALGLALGSSQPNVLALLHHASPAGRAAEAVGIRVTISNASQVVLPLAFGAAGAALGLFAIFWGMGVMIGYGVPIAWRRAYAGESEVSP
jgi:predicted MFS family arabinose efflux permease